MAAKLIWITPDADQMVGYLARVSNPKATPTDDATSLISYLLRNKHYSPFQMVSACCEIVTTRDIGRQILRHDFEFQEFSQRYSEVDQAQPSIREARLQDHTNRQNSLSVEDKALNDRWLDMQTDVWADSFIRYREAISLGIAKEQARVLLPEGLTLTKMYVSGTLRNWLFYLESRLGYGTQKEHQLVAEDILKILSEACPTIINAARAAGFNFNVDTIEAV